MYSENSASESLNTAHSCNWHSPATAELMSEWPVEVIPVRKISTVGSMNTLFLAIKSILLKLNCLCYCIIYVC